MQQEEQGRTPAAIKLLGGASPPRPLKDGEQLAAAAPPLLNYPSAIPDTKMMAREDSSTPPVRVHVLLPLDTVSGFALA